MPSRNADLHGNAPDTSRVALALVDVIISIAACRPVRGCPLARRLRPHATNYVVLKTKHSAFYATTFELLLRYLDSTTRVLAGLTGDRCVLFSASDAFMRDFRLCVPADCVASLDPALNRRTLDDMARLFDADLTDSTRLVPSRAAVRRQGRAGAARAPSGRARAASPARRSHAPAA